MKFTLSRFNLALVLCALFFLFPATTPILAQSSDEQKPIPVIVPTPRVNLPGLHFSSEEQIQNAVTKNENETRILHIPFLAEYVAAAYKYAVAIASILAVVMIIVAGIQWTISGGNTDTIGSAKKRITGAVTGLIIALGSYTLLYTISPELVQFRSLNIAYLEPIPNLLPDAEDDLTQQDLDSVPNAPPTDPSAIIAIPQLSNVTNAQNKQAKTELISALKNAMDNFSKKFPTKKIYIGSAYRSAEEQYAIMQNSCGCPAFQDLGDGDLTAKQLGAKCTGIATCIAGSSVSKVNGKLTVPHISHFGGTAIDLTVVGSKAGIPCSSENAQIQKSKGVQQNTKYGQETCVSKEQQQLIGTMLDAGFCVGLNANSQNIREAWHFEIGQKVSGFCAKKNDPFITEDKLYYAFHLDE